MSSTTRAPLPAYKSQFIQRAIDANVLLFGSFTLKSGRVSPYFFNAGLLYTGPLLSLASNAFAASLTAQDSRIPEFDVLLGPAYKGIPLSAVTCVTLYEKFGVERGYCYNRKEKKDHGEGGSLVGAPLQGRIVIIDDVVTAGTAIRESITLLSHHPAAKLVGILQLLDRQELAPSSSLSTVQAIESEFGVPVVPIIGMEDIVAYMEEKGGMEKELGEMREYAAKWGIKKD